MTARAAGGLVAAALPNARARALHQWQATPHPLLGHVPTSVCIPNRAWPTPPLTPGAGVFAAERPLPIKAKT